MCKCENGELAKCAGDNNSKTMCAILGHLSAEADSAAAAVATRTYTVISQLVNRLGHLIRLEYNKKWRMQTGAASRSDEYPQQITIIYARSHSASSGTGWKGHDGAQDVRQEPEERNGGVYEYECGSVRRYWVSSSHVKCIFYRTLLNLLSAVRLHSMPSSRSGSPFTRTHRQTHGNVLADRRAAGRHLHMLMARGLRCAWWVTFRTFYDFGFLMVTALVGAVLHCLSTVQCRFRSMAIDFNFKINCFRLSVDSCSTTCGSPMLRPAPDPVPIPFPALC